MPTDEAVRIVEEALQGRKLEQEETARIFNFIREEAPALLTPETTYLVLGSYQDPEIRRLRIVENKLNSRILSYAYLMSDLVDIEADDLPETHIKFHLLANYADYLVAIFEHGAGGAVTELGEITSQYFIKSFVLPRDYSSLSESEIDLDDLNLDAPYSQVHLHKFDLFDQYQRCFWWSYVNELRTKVEKIP